MAPAPATLRGMGEDTDARDARLEAREGLVPASLLSIEEARTALRGAVPTRWHAARLAEAVREALGPRAFLDPARWDDEPSIHVRDAADPDLLVATPLLSLSNAAAGPTIVATRLGPPRLGWPRAVPANCPEVWLELPPPPAPSAALRAAGFASVRRVVDAWGHVGHVFFRQEPRGWTAVGEHVADVVDLAALEADIDDAIARDDALLEMVGGHPAEHRRERRYTLRVFDDVRRAPRRAAHEGSEQGAKLGPAVPRGDVAPWRVLVERRGP